MNQDTQEAQTQTWEESHPWLSQLTEKDDGTDQSGVSALLSWDRSNLKEHVSFLSFSTHRTKEAGLATDEG